MSEQQPVEERTGLSGLLYQYNPFKERNQCMECKMIGTTAFGVLTTISFVEVYKAMNHSPQKLFQKRFFSVLGIGTNRYLFYQLIALGSLFLTYQRWAA